MENDSSRKLTNYSIEPKLLKAAVVEARDFVTRYRDACDKNFENIPFNSLQFYCDLGFSAEVYEILEGYLEQAVPLPEERRDLAKTYIGFMDISRNRRVKEWKSFYQKCLARYPSPSLVRARSLHALAIRQAMLGDDSSDPTSGTTYRQFCDAEIEYGLCGDRVASLKAAVGRLMLVRMANQQDRAVCLGEELLARADALGVSAVSPAAILYGALAGDHMLRGELYRARSLAWQGARIAEALPASKASGFSFFQWARIEFLLGSTKKAIQVAGKAERLQRVLDPLAHIATRMLMFQILRREGRFLEALTTAETILGNNLALTYQQDFEEFIDELFSLCVELGHESTLLKWKERARRPIALLPRAARQLLDDKISACHQKLKERWSSAKVVRKALNSAVNEAFLLIDKGSGCISGYLHGKPLDPIKKRGSHSSTWKLLERLLHAYETHTYKKSDAVDLQVFVAEEGGSSDEKHAATVRRRYRRAAQALSAAKVIHLHDLWDKTLVSLPPSVNIYVCG